MRILAFVVTEQVYMWNLGWSSQLLLLAFEVWEVSERDKQPSHSLGWSILNTWCHLNRTPCHWNLAGTQLTPVFPTEPVSASAFQMLVAQLWIPLMPWSALRSDQIKRVWECWGGHCFRKLGKCKQLSYAWYPCHKQCSWIWLWTSCLHWKHCPTLLCSE